MLSPPFEVRKGCEKAVRVNNHINCLWTVREINGQISRTQRMCKLSIQWNLLVSFSKTKYAI